MSARPTRLVLLGHPVAHSLSPAFQNAALRAAGIPLTYEALDVAPAAFADVLRGLAHQRGAGNVTIPYKEAAARECDRLTPVAARVGAVNCFHVEGGLLVGDNTDAAGFDALVHQTLGRRPANCRVALLGAGGSAAAVLAAAERWPNCYVAVWSRTHDRSRALASRFSDVAHAVPELADCVANADLVVNATPVGLADDAVPVAPRALRRGTTVVDLVYRRGETAWVRQARERGLRAADGLAMLVEQGALAFERWLGIVPDRDVMWAAVRAAR